LDEVANNEPAGREAAGPDIWRHQMGGTESALIGAKRSRK
jgi:hypothetical protein